MTRIVYPEFRDQLDTTKYPFGERVTLRNGTGQAIAEGAFQDAHLYPIGGQARLYLAQVVVTATKLTFTIGDASNPDLAYGDVSLSALTDNVTLQDAYGRPAGVLISERTRLAAFQSWGLGTFPFTAEQTEFAATCCFPTPEVGVRGLLLDDGSILSDQVWIVGADGVIVRTELVNLAGGCGRAPVLAEAIRVDIVGDPLFRRRLCSDAELFDSPRPIRKLRIVNGAYVFETEPTYGQFTIQTNDGLVADPALRIRATQDGLVFGVLGTKQESTSNHDTAVTLPPNYLR